MPWDLIDDIRAAEARILGARWAAEARDWALPDPGEPFPARPPEDIRHKAFSIEHRGMNPETRRRRAETRARVSAASRVRDRDELDLCGGTEKYLGVACPGCRACGEHNETSRGNPAEAQTGAQAPSSKRTKGPLRSW